MHYLHKGGRYTFLTLVHLCPGCQDPWNVNPAVPLEACTNITYIRKLLMCDRNMSMSGKMHVLNQLIIIILILSFICALFK